MCDRTIFEDPFMLVYCPDKYKVQKIHDECIDGCMEALKFISDWFVKSKMMKKLLLLYTQMIIYSVLMKILLPSSFLVMKWEFLV